MKTNAQKKKVVVNLLNFVSPEIAGAGVFAKNIFRLWLSESNSQTSVTLLHSKAIDVYKVFGIDPGPLIVSEAVSINNFFVRIFYEQIVLPFKIRKFDTYFSPTPVVPLAARLLKLRTKLVITIHDMIPFFVPNKYGFIRTRYVKFLSKYGARTADTVITVSENSRKDICKLTGINTDKIRVIYNFYPSTKSNLQVQYDRHFLSISTIEPGKNIENTIKGFKVFLDRLDQKDFKFFWLGKVGWGYTLLGLKKMIQQSGLESNFYLLGYVDEDRKNELLRSCTAMVYLSHYEGFGLPVLEALYFNKPSIVSSSSSLPEVVGNAGILCDKENVESIADAMIKITTDLPMYVSEIPGQLKKFDPALQIQKFLETLK